jgi:hypothetical protein
MTFVDDSRVVYDNEGKAIAFIGYDGTRLFQAITLYEGIGLLSKGVMPAEGWTMHGALKTVTAMFTGRKYNRTEWQQARADLKVWIENMKLALPMEIRKGD